MNYVIPIANQHSYKSIPRNKDLNLTIGNHCNYPSRVAVVDWEGNAFVCACEAWLPISVGNISNFAELTDIWNSDTAQALQQDINERKFTHCAVDRCGIQHNNIEQKGYYLSINIDESCNLRCPSCRKDKIMLAEGAAFDRKLAQVNHLVDMLERFDQPCHIVMSGNGDPLASHIMRPLLHRYQPKENHTIRLFTNGLLLEKQLSNNPIIKNITQYFISIDAGSADVYKQVRLGGTFDQLIKNLDYLKTVVKQTGAEVLLKFVLQETNYDDMQNFVDLCEQYNFRGVINRLEDWGTWDEYNRHDVIGNSNHTLHQASINNLVDIYENYCNSNNSFIHFNPSLVNICQRVINERS